MVIEAKRGDRVSLNTAKRSFYFQDGEFGISLGVGGKEVAIIPDKATDHQLAQINYDIKSQQLVLGWPEKAVEVTNRESELTEILALGRNKINEWMFSIRDDKKIKRDVKIEEIEKLVSLEKAGKNRSSVIDTAEKILSYMGGVSPVEETDTEKIEIKLTSGNSEEEAK